MSHFSLPPADFAAFVESLRRLPAHPHELMRGLFEPDVPIFVARAPGRLDIMGGIGDYSGSLVLEMPTAEAAFVSVQTVNNPGITLVSVAPGLQSEMRCFTLTNARWEALLQSDYAAVRGSLQADHNTAWAAYIIGPLLVLHHELAAHLNVGLRILIASHVPEGKGVSSSAALEVATMRAAAALLQVSVSGEEIARLCQLAENLVVGAPCGIMDQMTSALGLENQLLAIRCQPAIVEGYVPIPDSIAFWGIDSGIRHEVRGSDYMSVRIGAFMGYRIIAEAAGLVAKPLAGVEGAVEVEDPVWQGYLANLTPAEYHERFASVVPEEMSGREFLARHGGISDRVTRVDPARHYAVANPALHPIGENYRTHRFRGILEAEIGEHALRQLGDLMYEAHHSYSACGLGSEGTDLLVQLVREAGPASGLFGAKITGGGSGGTVVILGRADAAKSVEKIAHRYTAQTGRPTHIFHGSSPGACATEVQQITI